MVYFIRKSQPTPGDVHIDRPLTNLSVAFLQAREKFIADRVFPMVPVDSQSNKFFTYDRGQFWRDQMTLRAPGAESNEVGYSVTTDNYFADVWALHHDIPDQVRANADAPIRPDMESTELLMHQFLIKREKLWASSFFTTGVWTTDITGVNSAPSGGQVLRWNVANSTPIKDIDAGRSSIAKLTGYEPNVLVIGREVWEILRNHADIIDRIKYMGTNANPAVVTRQAVAQLLELDEILVAGSVENTAREGATNAYAFINGKNALLAYRAPAPGIMTPSAGYMFAWTGYTGAGAGGQRIRKFRMEHLASDRVELEAAFVHKKVSADMGYFFSTIVA